MFVKGFKTSWQLSVAKWHVFPPSVNCSDPTVPRNGSIDPYQNTLEGAEIVFRCDQGFDPAGDMTAVCAANGSWTPDPATHMCNCESTYNKKGPP